MASPTFFQKLDARWAAGARVCVGLDSQLDKIPPTLKLGKSSSVQLAFNIAIIDATKDLSLCYKPNLAFYEGPGGLQALLNTVAHIRNVALDVPIILDAKYGDIGNTNSGYARTAFDLLRCDAVTVHNYMGYEAMKPFLDRGDKGIIVLCKTSNPGSGEFQNLFIDGKIPLSHYVAERVATKWNYNGNCAVVVGATYPDHLKEIRCIVEDMWILLPGLGTQGGDVEASVLAGINSKRSGLIPNSSSGIIFADDPKAATQKLADEINAALEKVSA